MTSQRSLLAGTGRAPRAAADELAAVDAMRQDGTAVGDPVAADATAASGARAHASVEGHLDSNVVEELTRRLPTSELVKIIKGALECGRRNVPFTESDLLRTMTFGSSAVLPRQPSRPRSPRS